MCMVLVQYFPGRAGWVFKLELGKALWICFDCNIQILAIKGIFGDFCLLNLFYNGLILAPLQYNCSCSCSCIAKKLMQIILITIALQNCGIQKIPSSN